MAVSSHRRDPILEDLLEIENFPQALKHLNRKLKKAPKSRDLLVSKAQVQQRMGDNQAALEQCEELVKANPPVTDLDQLYQINQTLWHLGGNPEINARCTDSSNSLWKRAIQAQTAPVARAAIAKEWAQMATTCSQWSQVQQAAIVLHRDLADSDLDKRKYWFWQIVAQYLSSQQTSDEKMKSMLENLACMNLNKALSDMPTDSETAPKTASRWINSRSELELFALTSGAKQTAKAIELLDNKNLGPAKAPANDKWGALQVDRGLLAKLDRKAELAKMSREALDYAQKVNNEWKKQDLALWMDTIIEGLDLRDAGSALEFATNASRPGQGSRSARLALLTLLQQQKHAGVPDWGQALFQATFESHVEAMMSSPVLQNDLDALLDCFTLQESEELPKYGEFIKEKASTIAGSDSSESAQLKWITAEANALGFDLKTMQRLASLTLQNVSNTSELSVQDLLPITQAANKTAPIPLARLVNFITSCVQLYKVARLHTAKLHKYDPDPGDTALVLAAQALSWASEITKQQRYKVLGACLLQFLLAESEHNSKVRMMSLVRLQELGLHSLAAEAYTKLGVKGILHESCDLIFYTRLSVYHPKATRNFKPDDGLATGLKFYEDSLSAATDYQSVAMDEQNYGSVLRFQEFQERLRNSPTRRLLWLERRRVRRILDLESEGGQFSFDIYPPDPLHRSTSHEINHAPAQDKPLEVPPNCGLPVSHAYLTQLNFVDQVLLLVRSEPPKPEEAIVLFDQNNPVIEDAKSFMKGLTDAEARCYAIARDLASLARAVYTQSQTLGEVETLLAKLLATLETLPVFFEATETYKRQDLGLFPTWQTFEACYCEVDILKGVLQLSARIQTALKGRFKKEKAANREAVETQLKKAKSVASSLHKRHRAVVADWRKRLVDVKDTSPEQMISLMIEHQKPGDESSADAEHLKVLGEEVLDLVGPQSAAKIFGSFLQSGIEACDSYLSLPEELSKAG